MKEEQLAKKEYLQNVGNHLQLVIEQLTALALEYDMELELIPHINELVAVVHSVHEVLYKYEQLSEHYAVGNDMLVFDSMSALQKFLEDEVL